MPQPSSSASFQTTAGDLALLVQGQSRPEDAGIVVTGFASLDEAQRGDVTFFQDPRYAESLKTTKASAVLVPADWAGEREGVAIIRVASPTVAFDQVLEKYGWHPAPFEPGVHPTAVVASGAALDPAKVSVGAHAIVEEGAVIGEGVTIGAGSFVGRNVRIGNGCHLYPRVTVQDGCLLAERVILHSGVVIGADGFGYEFENGRHRKVKQRGIVQIDPDVEIGANSTIDRARYGRTRIGAGTKIDNLVQVGHNVTIGRCCILVACVAIAGSAVIGDYVVMGAQVGIAGHVTVGSQAQLGARCGVTKSLEGGRAYLGYPAIPAEKEKKRIAGVSRLGKLNERVRELESQLAALQQGKA